MRKLNVTQAGATSAAIAIIGQVIAVVPSLSPEKEGLISTASLVIAAVFALAHLAQQFIDGKHTVTLQELEGGVRQVARSEAGKALGEVDLNKLAEAALAGANIPAVVKAEAQKLLGPIAQVLSQPDPAPAPVVPAPVPPAVPPVA